MVFALLNLNDPSLPKKTISKFCAYIWVVLKHTLLLFILFASLTSRAQQPAYFMFAQEHLEGIDIYDVIQDKELNYYFATDQGIFVHDGYTFRKIECDEMSGASVFHFVINSDGVIYCHNLNKQVFQIKDGSCTLIYSIPDSGINLDIIITSDNHLLISSSSKIYLLNSKNQLINTKDLGFSSVYTSFHNLPNNRTILYRWGVNIFWLYENGKWRSFPLKMENGSKAPSIEGLHFFEVKNQTFAISIPDNKVYRIDEKTLALRFITEIKLNSTKGRVRFYGVGGQLWITSNISGVTKVSNYIETSVNESELFSDFFISDIFKDKEGNLLLSTFDAGVIVIPNLKVNDVEPLFNPYSVTRLHSVKDNLVLGTRDGKILQYKDQVREISISGAKPVEELSVWPEKEIILSDNLGFSLINLNSGLENHFSFGSLKDVAYVDDNRLFAALNIGLYEYSYDPKTNVLSEIKRHLEGRMYKVEHEELTNSIYVSTFDGLKYLDNNRKIQSITLNKEIIHAISLFSLGDKTYISTRKNGVLVLKKGEIIDQYYPKHNSEILLINKLLIHNSVMYANTQIGFVMMDLNGKIRHLLNKSWGLSTNKIIDFAIIENTLWVAHSRGVQQFRIDDITSSVEAPKLKLKYVLVNGLRTNKSAPHAFENDQNKFTFILQVPTLRHRENIRYHYKLEGTNEQWVIHDYEDNEIVYNALAPGDYRFVVRAENNGVYSKKVYYSFTISAPFYERIWFIVLVGLVLLIGISLIYRRLLAIQRKKARHINELNASRLTAIQSQMNPHFIFNSLNSIQDLVLKGDVDNSYTFITKFSNLVRRTLNYSDKDFIEFEQEIKLLELYLSLEKLRFKEDLTYTLETNGIEDILIPPMLIQPFIENALIHGLLHKEGGKELSISFSINNAILSCEIRDNGIGRKRAQEIKERQRGGHESFAVNAINKRFAILQQHFGEQLGFFYTDSDEGTTVRITLPFRKKF